MLRSIDGQDRVFLTMVKDFGIEVEVEVDTLEGGGVQVDQKCVCMYAYGRYPLEATTFARGESLLSFLSAFFFFFVDAQAAIDTSAHLQLTPRDSDFIMRAEPHLHYDKPTTEEGKNDAHPSYYNISPFGHAALIHAEAGWVS